MACKEIRMFKHILLPTDGSAASESAILQGISLAREHKARVTGLYVKPTFHVLTYRTQMLEDTPEQYAKDVQEQTERFLSVITKAAQENGVPCDTTSVTSDYPYEAIIETADEKGCDLITMASHGHKGARGFLLGSETQKVLTHCKKPVLVLRPA